MNNTLLKISTEELLEKFGAGDHKPGSGSAAAFQGMLSAKLLVTVISLTNKEKYRKRYSEWLPNLLEMARDIQDRIYPELTKLFQEDSIQFDKAIKLRIARDNENNLIAKNHLSQQALVELKPAIDIPIKIAKLNVELAKMAQFAFDNAFKGARGDSQVALSGSVSALAGCISIIQLNLLSFGHDEYKWTEKIIADVRNLKNVCEDLNAISNSKIKILEGEVKDKAILNKEVNMLIDSIRSKQNPTDFEIENSAIQFQRLVWRHREKIWKEDISDYPNKILNPSIIFKKVLGYEFYKSPELGINYGQKGVSEIAGLIDQKNKLVLISESFPEQTQNFTSAHELGHALFHKQAVMHRDRPIDGVETKNKRNTQELQADKFASYFLMPRKQVIEVFQEHFLTEKFVINENTAFSLNQGRPSDLRFECKDLRGLSLKLAKTESFASRPFVSIAKLFNVSIKTMAIRLEELELVEF